MLIENGIPRRSKMQRWIPAETKLYELTQEIERLGVTFKSRMIS